MAAALHPEPSLHRVRGVSPRARRGSAAVVALNMETTPDAFDPKRPADAGPGRDRLRRWVELALALAIPVVGVLALCRFFSPHWQTNDDIGMSMIAHGYGSVAQASPKLGFSNLLWGHFVRALPAVGGLLGYSVATFASLIAVGMALLHGLRLSTRSWLASIALVCGVLVLPVLFPQFTVNAGLLMIAALVCWRTYGQRGTWPWLLCGCVLAFASALVRNQEALLVFAIGCPLLPWGRLLRDRAARFAGVALVLAIGLATFANRQAYQGPEWQAFKALNPLRMRITDYGADKPLRRSPQLLRQQGLSQNDLNLLRAWFFVDPEIADPQRLKPLLAQLPPRYAASGAWQRGLDGVLVFAHPALLPLLLAGLLLALLYPDRRVLATWLLCIAAVFALAVVFRPGVLRVYVPLASLLFLAPFICNAATRDPPRWRWRVAPRHRRREGRLQHGPRLRRFAPVRSARCAHPAQHANAPAATVRGLGRHVPVRIALPWRCSAPTPFPRSGSRCSACSRWRLFRATPRKRRRAMVSCSGCGRRTASSSPRTGSASAS
ncbi:MAG: hypothetical protein U1F20_00500 [Lysobacterales bacterium]